LQKKGLEKFENKEDLRILRPSKLTFFENKKNDFSIFFMSLHKIKCFLFFSFLFAQNFLEKDPKTLKEKGVGFFF